MGDQQHQTIHVGSRRSDLALCQTREVVGKLSASGGQFSIVQIDTVGDISLARGLPLVEGKGLFTRELDASLMAGEIRFVVHSVKDLPMTCPPGLAVPCITRRELPFDALVLHPRHAAAGVRDLAGLPPGSVLGTSSLRRSGQLARAHPGLRFESVRGNLGARWRKLLAEDSCLDGLILAEAGLARMGWSDRVACRLTGCFPAVGQGALAVQCRADDQDTVRLLRPLLDRDTFLETVAERSLLRALDAGFAVPLGVLSTWLPEGAGGLRRLRLEAQVLSADGAQAVEFAAEAPMPEATAATPADGDSGRPDAEVGLRYPDPGPRDLGHLAACARLGRTVARGLLAGGARSVMASPHAKGGIREQLPPAQVA